MHSLPDWVGLKVALQPPKLLETFTSEAQRCQKCGAHSDTGTYGFNLDQYKIIATHGRTRVVFVVAAKNG